MWRGGEISRGRETGGHPTQLKETNLPTPVGACRMSSRSASAGADAAGAALLSAAEPPAGAPGRGLAAVPSPKRSRSDTVLERLLLELVEAPAAAVAEAFLPCVGVAVAVLAVAFFGAGVSFFFELALTVLLLAAAAVAAPAGGCLAAVLAVAAGCAAPASSSAGFFVASVRRSVCAGWAMPARHARSAPAARHNSAAAVCCSAMWSCGNAFETQRFAFSFILVALQLPRRWAGADRLGGRLLGSLGDAPNSGPSIVVRPPTHR